MRERQAEEATRREAFEVRSDEGRSHRKTGETCFSQASRCSEMVPVGGTIWSFKTVIYENKYLIPTIVPTIK